MKLAALRLHDVRRFADRGIAVEGIGEGVNVLCAANEHGKSTCFDALHALFFTPHTSEAAVVQALRPYSGGQPQVEADIVAEAGRFRLTKRFGGGRRATVTDLGTGRIVAQSGEAEAFIAGLVRGGAAEPAGLLWVRQGRTGLDRRPKDEDGEKRSREDILSSVRGEVEALTGGRRMAEVARACQDALGLLVTATGRAKAGGPYAIAIERRDRLAAEDVKLRGETEALRAALARRREVVRRLADIERPDEEAARRAALAGAEAAHAAAAADAAASAAVIAEAATLADRRQAAERALDGYRTRLDRARHLARRRDVAAARRDEALARRREAAASGEAAQDAASAAEREEEDARHLLARLERAMQARDAAERRAGLAKTLAEARAVREEVERIEARMGTLAIAADDLRRLEAQEIEIAGLRAAVAARAATVRAAYGPSCAGAIRLGGTPLREAEERPLPPVATIEIEGIGTLTVTSPRSDAEEEALRNAEAARRALLGRLGVTDLAAAHRRAAAVQELKTDLAVAHQRLALLAPEGIAALREAHARLAVEAAPDDAPAIEPQAAQASLSAAAERARQARHAEREARPRRTRADEALIEAEKDLVAVAATLDELETLLGPAPDRAARLAALERDLAEAARAAEAARERAEAKRAVAVDLPRLEDGLRRARSVVEAARAEAEHLRRELAGLSGAIRARTEEGIEEAFAETAEALRAAEADVARLAHEVAVLTRLRAALDTARNAAREHYFAPVMRELSPLLGLLFDDASVTFDEATLLPRLVHRNGLEEPVGSLSGGAREQLAVLTRLAFGRLLARAGHPAPVILDDALVYSDDDRIERMFDVLHRQAREQQIIVFSCRQRAFQRLGGNVLRMVSWEPAAR